MRLLFDSNVFDAILRHDDLQRLQAAQIAGHIAILATPRQQDELRRIRDPQRRTLLLNIYSALRPELVAVAADPMHAADDVLANAAGAARAVLVSEDQALVARTKGAIGYAALRARLAMLA